MKFNVKKTSTPELILLFNRGRVRGIPGLEPETLSGIRITQGDRRVIAEELLRRKGGYNGLMVEAKEECLEFLYPSKIGYMCMTDFDYELGHASGGNKVYPSLMNIRHNSKCCKLKGCCGIVEVMVSVKRVVKKEPKRRIPKCSSKN